ncbi:MAG: M16 family metallopeptidase [Candidatus Baltobacteraceae bacterium]
MKRLLVPLFLLMVPLLGVRAQAQTFNGIGDRGVYQTRLSNGLQVIAVEDSAAPVVHTSVFYRFGSLDETPGKTGLAHGLEHMMFRGTPSLSAGGLDDIMARLGAQMNGTTAYDDTTFLLDMPSDRLNIALQIEADRMQHLALRAADWRIEQRAVLNEIDGDYSSPFYNLLARVRAAAYPDAPAGRTPAGVRSDVARATVADLRRYYEEWYAPDNAALVVAGDVRHDAVFALARRFFGAIPRRTLPAHAALHPVAATGKTVEAEFPFPFEVLDLAYAVPGDTERGEPAISTLAALIPNQRGAFYQALVQTNIALEITANADTQLRGGLMHVFVTLNPGHTGAQAQQVFQATMDEALKNGFGDDLVAAAKRATIADRVYSGDSISGLADLAGYTYGIVRERNSDEDARLAALTAGDVLNAARRYLSSPNVIGHLTPNDRPASGSQKTSAGNADNFSGRAPSGAVVIPAQFRAELQTPSAARSKLDPVRFTLANGLHVLVQPKTDRQTVYISGTIVSSPQFVPAGKEGIARLASSLANFGSAQYDFSRLRKVTDDMGASVDLGETFGAHGLARDFDTLLSILADGEEHPSFPEQWLTQERSQIANSVKSEQQLSSVLVEHVYLSRLLQPADPALRFESADTVSSITREDLLAYTGRYWRPDLTTIAIVGDVTPAQARAAAEKAFGTWRRQGPAPRRSEPALPAAHAGRAYISTSSTQLFVQLGQPAVARSSADFDAFRLLTEMLGGSGYFQSRLWQELRQKRGLVYSIGTEMKADASRGDLEIAFSASPQNAPAAIALVRREMNRLRSARVSPAELAQAKLRLVSEALLNEGSADGQLDEVLAIGNNDLPVNYFAALSQRYASITAADIQRIAMKYLRPNALIEVFAGPPGPWGGTGL